MTSPRDILDFVAEMTAAGPGGDHAAGTPRYDADAAGGGGGRRRRARAAGRRGRWWWLKRGPGNNGEATALSRPRRWPTRAGWSVTLALAGERGALKGDAALAAASWTGPTVALEPAAIAGAELIIDAVFGAGLSKPPGGLIADTLRAAEASAAPLVAIDLPSGLAGDIGRPLGFAPRSALTVTFHRKKPAHVLEPGRSLCGEVVVADIGLGPTPTKLFENGPDLWGRRFPWPATNAHKHSRGRLIVVSGEMWSTGAARLAARAGLRIGAGLVTVLSPADALLVNAAAPGKRSCCACFEHRHRAGRRPPTNADAAIASGPAAVEVNEATVSNLFALARTGAAIVIDADALTAFRDDPGELFSVLDRDDVLTPHPGEFERVFPGLLNSAPERITAARQAAAPPPMQVILLKGPDTVIAAPDGRCCVNTNGAPWLRRPPGRRRCPGRLHRRGWQAQGMDSFDAACARLRSTPRPASTTQPPA